MNGRIDSGLGQIVIDTDVIATYAGSVAVECFGIIGMAAISMKDGLVKLLRIDSLKHGISVKITDDPAEFSCHRSIWREYQYYCGQSCQQCKI